MTSADLPKALAATHMFNAGAVVWFDVQGGDPERPWLIKRGDRVTRARRVDVVQATTDYKPEGFSDLKPSGPRGVLLCREVYGADEVPV